MTEALDAARSAYSKWYTIQSRVAVLANAFLILAQPVKLSTVSRGARIIPRAAPSRDWGTQVSDVIVLGGAASTYYCTRSRVRINSFLGDDAAEMKFRSHAGGRQVLKCKKSELLVMYQLYALCCPRQCITHRDCCGEMICPPQARSYASR